MLIFCVNVKLTKGKTKIAAPRGGRGAPRGGRGGARGPAPAAGGPAVINTNDEEAFPKLGA